MDDYDSYNSTYFDHQDYYDHDDSSPHSSIHRLLAPAGGTPTVDYGVISVVIITLGIVLAVEVLRHQLDVAANGHPFFHTVLELMYRERELLHVDIVEHEKYQILTFLNFSFNPFDKSNNSGNSVSPELHIIGFDCVLIVSLLKAFVFLLARPLFCDL